jgi:uncharacterized protein
MSLIIFITLFVVGLFAIAFFTAKIYSRTLKLSHPISYTVIISSILVPLFFIANLIASRSSDYLSPTIYTFVNILAGFAFYMFLGAVTLTIASLIAFFLKASIPLFIAWIILGISLAFAITGLIQARFITIKEYTVTLSGAPASWDEKTAVLVADTHFGLTNHKKFSDNVVNHILDIHPDFVLHAGDFYDGPNVDTVSISDSWKRLTDVMPVFYAPGNHEGYGKYAAFIQSVKDAGIEVLDDKKIEYDGVTIAGIVYRNGKHNPEATEAIEQLDIHPDKAAILINHPPTSIATVERASFDLMVSGHTHNGQFWPVNYIVKRMYRPYQYGLKKFKDLHVLTTSGVGTFGPPMRLFNSPKLVLIHFKVK